MAVVEGKVTPVDAGLVQRVVQGTKNIIGRTTTSAKFIVTGVAPNGFFTPQQPIQPIAQESAIGRQFDYRAGINVNIQPKVSEGSGISYPQLRALADSLDVLRLVIETRKDQVATLDWTIAAKEGKTVSDTTLETLKEKISQPTPEYDFDMWLRMILEDMFVIDAVCIYPRLTRGGDIYSLDLIDGATIKRVIDDGGRTPIAPDPAYQQILKGVPAVDYTTDELIYRMRNPRTNRMYGYSPVEQIIMTVNIALRRQLYQLQHYTEGNIPEALASVPESWNPDQIAQMQMYFDSLLQGNQAARSRLKFVPVDTSKIKETKDANLKDDFDEWLARIVCYCFSVPPTPFIKQMNRATAQTGQEVSQQEGMKPLLNWVKKLMDFIIANLYNAKDVEFIWEQADAVDPAEQASIDKIYADAGIRTANEIRADRGWEPLPEPQTNEPVNSDAQQQPPAISGAPNAVPAGGSQSPTQPKGKAAPAAVQPPAAPAAPAVQPVKEATGKPITTEREPAP